MEKKLWSNAEIVELGVENTREETGETGEPMGPLTPYHCPWCNEGFFTEWGLNEHKKCCKKKPIDWTPIEPSTPVPGLS